MSPARDPGFAEASSEDLREAFDRARPALATLDGGRVLLTGGTGFFGRWLIALIGYARREFDIELVILTRDPEGFQRAYPGLATLDGVALAYGDVRYFEYPKGRFTHVIHAATDTSVEADRDPATLISVIVDGTRRVLEFCQSVGVKRLLYVSSGAIYGRQPAELTTLPESYRGACDPLDPRSAYGQAKRLGEQMCVCQASPDGQRPVIARAFAFVGPGMPLGAHFAIGNFIADAAAGRDIVVTGDGTPMRGYLYAGDLAAWLVTLLAFGEAGAAYNVGSDDAISIGDLARRVAELSGGASRVDVRGRPTPGDPRARYVPSVAKAGELGLQAWTSLDEAVRRTLEWARRRPAAEIARKSSLAHRNEGAEVRRLTFVVDVDGVVASLVPGNDYARAEPLTSTIAAVNRLFEQGHRIVMFTARGSATGLDWSATTRAQLDRWGLKFHELRFGKPAADYYIDDRSLPLSALTAMTRVG